MGLGVLLLTGLTCLAQGKVEKASQTYKNIHSKAILVDNTMISYHKQWTTASLLIRTCAENT
jgi:hypothetical protein